MYIGSGYGTDILYTDRPINEYFLSPKYEKIFSATKNYRLNASMHTNGLHYALDPSHIYTNFTVYLVTPRYIDAPLEKPLLFLKFINPQKKKKIELFTLK